MNWELSGKYLVYEPGAWLVFTWQWQHRPDLPQRTVAVTFETVDGGTRLAIAHSAYGNTAIEQEDRQSHIDGWLHFLGRLQQQTK